MVDLKTFVSETIQQVIESARDAGVELKQKISTKDGEFQVGNNSFVSIQFDISVTYMEEKQSSAGGGVSIQVLKIGAEKSDVTNDQSINHIKFSVPVRIPASGNRNIRKGPGQLPEML